MAKAPTLEYYLEKTKQNAEEGIIDPDIEISAVHNLHKKKDIQDFYMGYTQNILIFIKNEIEEDKDTRAAFLAERGYELEYIAEYFVYDGLLFTLGHIHNQKILDTWYPLLPDPSRFPKDMWESYL